MIRIANIRRGIIEWSRKQNLNSNISIKKIQDELEAALSDPAPDNSRIGDLTSRLEAAYKEEELYWRQRSRILWL